MRANDLDVTGSVRTTDPEAVAAEVLRLFRGLFPAASTARLERAFADAAGFYAGRHADYRACDTEYHDLQHVLDVTLAMARLMDGYQRGRSRGEEALGADHFTVGALAALFHDFGYLRRRNDNKHRYGAEYTLVHVSRGASFLRAYARGLGLPDALAGLAARLVHFTGYERAVETIRLPGALPRRIGQMLGTADIIAQMSDRCYLEKCRTRLFPEFVLGRLGANGRMVKRSLPVFASGDDLVHQTPAFYQGAARRLDFQLARSYEYATRHFGGDNLYFQAMERNIRYAEMLAAASGQAMLSLRRLPPSTLAVEVEPYPKDLLGV
jgi:hypothetical protein